VETAVDHRYPIGKLIMDPEFDAVKRAAAIDAIARMPPLMAAAVHGLTDAQIDTPYREGGWTVRQVVHHVADSHMNAYVRCKLIVTEHHPPLKSYDEKLWAGLIDSTTMPVDLSLAMLDGLHQRWITFLESLAPEDFARTGEHSERGSITMDTLLQIYGWHSRHHVAHITELRRRMHW
jgi:DinB superfamily